MRRIKMDPVLTGTSYRMATLPHIDISSIENHSTDEQPFQITSDDLKQNIAKLFSAECSNRKCVYTYEDKYSFPRIISSDYLIFDSHFESGNLHSAFRLLDNSLKYPTYDLYLHSDINAIGHNQWFYFSVSNVRKGQQVSFVIRNFSKAESLYNEGMRPLIYSAKSKKGWQRCGTEIAYFNSSNNTSSTPKKDNTSYAYNYIMHFNHIFEFSDDICYFAYCVPYTYTDLQVYLNKLSSDPLKSKYLRRSILCKTNAGNICDMLTITNPCASPKLLNERVYAVLTARVHPGESNSSWIIQGIVDYLLSSDPDAVNLREKFVFKIIPMLNPDGVINGNYRTSLAGCDLNRRWTSPDKILHPTIYYTKEMIKRFNKKCNKIGVMIDIHGHSSKQGVFVYGCVPDRRLLKPSHTKLAVENTDVDVNLCDIGETGANFPSASTTRRDVINWRVKLLPRIFDAFIPLFSFNSCSFKMNAKKSSTMRIITFTELGIDCVYTIEASLAGKFPSHFTAFDLLSLGKELSKGFTAAYHSLSPVLSENDYLVNSTLFMDEIRSWRKYYDPRNSGWGKLLMSEQGLQILYGTIMTNRLDSLESRTKALLNIDKLDALLGAKVLSKENESNDQNQRSKVNIIESTNTLVVKYSNSLFRNQDNTSQNNDTIKRNTDILTKHDSHLSKKTKIKAKNKSVTNTFDVKCFDMTSRKKGSKFSKLNSVSTLLQAAKFEIDSTLLTTTGLTRSASVRVNDKVDNSRNTSSQESSSLPMIKSKSLSANSEGNSNNWMNMMIHRHKIKTKR